jgi:hypothetical protein
MNEKSTLQSWDDNLNFFGNFSGIEKCPKFTRTDFIIAHPRGYSRLMRERDVGEQRILEDARK